MPKKQKEPQFDNVLRSHTKALGAELALFLTYLYSFQQFYKKKKELLDGKWFYRSIACVDDDLGMSNEVQQRLIHKLSKLDLIEKCTRYNPVNGQKTRYFYVREMSEIEPVIDRLLLNKELKAKKEASELNFNKKKQDKEGEFAEFINEPY